MATSRTDGGDDHTASSYVESATVLSQISSSCENNDYRADPQNQIKHEAQEVLAQVKREAVAVRFWRIVFLFLFSLTGIGVSTLAALFLVNEEQTDFTRAYYLFSASIEDITKLRVKNLFQALRDESETITSHAVHTNQTFPFVTAKDFEVSGQHVRLRAGIEVFTFVPKVSAVDREAWEIYSAENQGWLEESRTTTLLGASHLVPSDFVAGNISPVVYDFATGQPDYAADRDIYFPLWQQSPPPFEPTLVNFDLGFLSYAEAAMGAVEEARDVLIAGLGNAGDIVGSAYSAKDHDNFHDKYVERVGNETANDRPHAYMYTPVYESMYDTAANVGGHLISIVPFDLFMVDLLPDTVTGVHCVVRNSCGEESTYVLTGDKARYLGMGDLHDTKYDNMEVVIPFHDYISKTAVENLAGHCIYSMHLYPSVTFEDAYKCTLPYKIAGILAAAFFMMSVTFAIYDLFVGRRNHKIVNAAVRSNIIVSGLFPAKVKNQLLLRNDDASCNLLNGKKRWIADFFPEVTIICADIAGFTAWSSSREPVQVFQLLETLFHKFDSLAMKRRVYKVETIGDCYVAVCGLPDPRKDHHVIMARFARDCLKAMQVLTKKLEVTLGPDTADLSLRIGLHSGPVTAGVLRGERSRFQLFGETMNTASRMESTGCRNRIHTSQETAKLLIASGKEAWLTKGATDIGPTFWLSPSGHAAEGSCATSSLGQAELQNSFVPGMSEGSDTITGFNSDKIGRLIEWNTEVLAHLLEQLVQSRAFASAGSSTHIRTWESASDSNGIDPGQILESVQESIEFSDEFAMIGPNLGLSKPEKLGTEVLDQLSNFVGSIAAMYRSNEFHNFAHASHVTMSVVKLLSRIQVPIQKSSSHEKKACYGTEETISHPLVQFACVFSALIHDIDHPGVPNAQLVLERNKLAEFYRGKAVAEQNSVELALSLLEDPVYVDLRGVIFSTEAEKQLFRQLVINSVMATDVIDEDLKALRNSRWERVFGSDNEQALLKDFCGDHLHRKATIVIEHLIQASDIAHTMQHWHVYRKWNEAFFQECYAAYLDGRRDEDPAIGWYHGELGFFDFYVIPLAKKLKSCGVFGVSSSEYLQYAIENRAEWAKVGRKVVEDMTRNFTKQKQSLSREAIPNTDPLLNNIAPTAA